MTTTSVRARPRRLSGLSIFPCKSVFYGTFVGARALNSQKWLFPARAVNDLIAGVVEEFPGELRMKARVRLGFGRIAALCCRPSTLYRICEEIRRLYF
jgi:hypothetical protein